MVFLKREKQWEERYGKFVLGKYYVKGELLVILVNIVTIKSAVYQHIRIWVVHKFQ